LTITYEYGSSLYVNITNRCPNNCDFCVRTHADGFYSENSLWLEREPSRYEILNDILSHDLSSYAELVFCGYGEPTERLPDMIWVCRNVKAASSIPIRLNTNGQCNLIWKGDMSPLFEDAFDTVSVSLNAADAKTYDEVCHSVYGEDAYAALIDFASRVKEFVPKTMFSVVRTTIPEDDLQKCREIAEKAGVSLRIRELV